MGELAKSFAMTIINYCSTLSFKTLSFSGLPFPPLIILTLDIEKKAHLDRSILAITSSDQMSIWWHPLLAIMMNNLFLVYLLQLCWSWGDSLKGFLFVSMFRWQYSKQILAGLVHKGKEGGWLASVLYVLMGPMDAFPKNDFLATAGSITPSHFLPHRLLRWFHRYLIYEAENTVSEPSKNF